MRVIVADASAMVEYLLRTARARPIVMIVEGDDVDVQVPALCDVEVVAALRRALAAGRLDDSRAAEAVTDYCDLPITRHGHLSLLSRALQLRFNFSSYDAAYVALAELLRAELLTADARLARAVRMHLTIGVLAPSIWPPPVAEGAEAPLRSSRSPDHLEGR